MHPRTDGAADLVSFSVYRTCRLFVCVRLRVHAVFALNATLIFSLIIIIIIIIIIITRQLSYRKDDRAMRPIYGCPENFESRD